LVNELDGKKEHWGLCSIDILSTPLLICHSSSSSDSPARAALHAYATRSGHPSVEAWLRTLQQQPQQLDSEGLCLLLPALSALDSEAAAAAADLFLTFVPETVGDFSAFSPSLLQPDAPLLREGTDMCPKAWGRYMECEFK
jgi:hypothetical protein